MTLKELNSLIDAAIDGSAIRPNAMPETNALNAEYALGAIFAYLNLIWTEYGIDAMIEAKDRTQASIDELTDRTQVVYNA